MDFSKNESEPKGQSVKKTGRQLMAECKHEPKCQFICRICESELLDFPDVPEIYTSTTWEIEFDNGMKHIVPGKTEEEARQMSLAAISRAAGLCEKHIARIVNVRRF